jgi:hypothetical protein
MESSLERTKLNLKSKIPEIEKTLELVRVLQEKHVGTATVRRRLFDVNGGLMYVGVYICCLFLTPPPNANHTHIHTQEAGEGLTTHYSLADTIYAKADVECNGTVCLWLGVSGWSVVTVWACDRFG